MYQILQWNCQGYRSKYEDLCVLLSQQCPAVAVLQETMLSNNPKKPPSKYTAYTEFNNPTPGNGLATLIRNDIPHSKLNVQSRLQITAFSIKLSKRYTICNMYISPNEIVQLNELTNIIEQLPTPIIICGDFNSHHPSWDNMCTQQDARSTTIENLLLNSSMVLLNTGQPTHFYLQTGSSSAIDLSMCSADTAVDYQWSVMEDLYGSDHYPILLTEINPEPCVRERRYIEDRADWNIFYQSTFIVNTEDLLENLTIDDLIESYNNHIIQAANISIPKSSGKTQQKIVPWWNHSCREANDKRRRALRRYQRSKLNTDKIEYCRARAIAKRTKFEAKQKSWQDYVTTLNEKTPMRKIWNRIRKIRGRYQSIGAPYLIENNIHVSDEREVAELMANHYQTISSNDSYNNKFKRIRQALEIPLQFATNSDLNYNSPITMLELTRMLSICNKSATGEDQISYNMIKHSHETCQMFLLNIMNKIFSSGQFPSQWLSGIVLSFPKPGKDNSKRENYRPISLTSCTGKLMEKIINNRLVTTLESNKQLPTNQFGFRKMHSTIDALNRFSTDVTNALNNKQHVLCVSFDMKKAYDTTWRYGILRSLHTMGFRGSLPIYIKNFLTNRTFKTKINRTYSIVHTIDQGVPQGGVLSCTLFSLAINGILNCIPSNIGASLYVDDLLVYCSGFYVPGLERRLQTTINKINDWANSHGFTFSQPKTHCIHFHRRRAFQPPQRLMLENSIICNRDSIKYLGMTFDCKLTWREHIKDLKIRCMKGLDLLKCLSHTTWGSDRTTMLRLYRAIIRSKMDYASFIYNSAAENILKLLDPVHNAALRLCTGAYRSSPVISIYADSGEPPLNHRRELLALQYYARTLQLETSAAFSYVQPQTELRPDNLTKNTTYSERITKTLSEMNLNISTITFKYQAIPLWQAPTDTKCNKADYPKKKSCSDQMMKLYFLEHSEQHHSDQIHIYTDGSKNNEGVGCSAVSLVGGRRMKLMRESSVFTAELTGILLGLNIALTTNRTNFVIFSDSRSAIQVAQHYDSTHPLVNQIILRLLKVKERHKSVTFCWCPGHVGIPGNEKADSMAVEAASSNDETANDAVPYRDWYPIVKRKMKEKWLREWLNVNANKLRKLKDTVEMWPSSSDENRKYSIIITRLRIGHTKATHQYLMEGGVQPYCGDCIVPLTVKHVLAECPTYSDTRRRLYPETEHQTTDQAIRTILSEQNNQNFNTNQLMTFIREIGLYDNII